MAAVNTNTAVKGPTVSDREGREVVLYHSSRFSRVSAVSFSRFSRFSRLAASGLPWPV
jgi:hypothetical protein